MSIVLSEAPADLAAEYAALLARMDWQFELSDCHRTWQRGRDALARLRELQPQVDPTGAQWIAASGTDHGTPQPRVTWPDVKPRGGEPPRAPFPAAVPGELQSLHPVMQQALAPFWRAS